MTSQQQWKNTVITAAQARVKLLRDEANMIEGVITLTSHPEATEQGIEALRRYLERKPR